MTVTIVFLTCTLILTHACTPVNRELREERARLTGQDQQREDFNLHPEVRVPEPEVPEFVPVKEDVSPLTLRRVSISARNTPLRDVLYTITGAANLNLIMGDGVDPESPVTISLRDVPVDMALKAIFDSLNYFYSIDDNVLKVSAVRTEIFEIGQPAVTQDYKINVGGDILSGIASAGEGSSSSLKGDISLQSSTDSISFQFWDGIENSLKTILGITDKGAVNASRRLVINRMTGTVMVTAPKNEMERVRHYISNVKKILGRQVMIEARIVEVKLSDALRYGIDWSAVGRVINDLHMNADTHVFADVVSTVDPNIEVGITDNENVTVLLRALEEQGEVRTLSNPKVNIMNGQTAVLSVGRNTSFISRVETTTSTSDGGTPLTTFTVDTNSILSGVIFGIVPYINSQNEITLSITPIVSNLVDLEEKLIGTSGNSVEIKLPVVDLREMSTTIKVLDGQLVIIGGLIEKDQHHQEDRVPVVGKIPILGNLFKRVDRSEEKTELVIMLIPRILS